jgi:hypothetical protein
VAAVHANPEADRLIREGAKLSAAGAPGAQEPLERAVALAPEDPNMLVRAAGLSFDNGRLTAMVGGLRERTASMIDSLELCRSRAEVGPFLRR